MKHIRIFLYFIVSSITHCMTADPLIVAVLMVKNEEHVIVQTLKPLVDGGIDAYFIFDTGSTDATIEKTREFLQVRNIKDFYIMQEPFIDFSISRNRALDLAEHYFPQADFMLMLDAEWELQNTQGLIDFCLQYRNDQEAAYLLRTIQNRTLDYYNCRLIRCRRHIRFTCPVHEYIDYQASVKVPEHIFFAWNRTAYGAEKSAQRWTRDLAILLKEYQANPHDPRTVFYLAQTYECLNEPEKAYHFYHERARMGTGNTWDEETYMAYYRLAQITELLAHTYNDRYDWSQALSYYLKAHALRPGRAEPLIKIAAHYMKEDNHVVAYLFASRAMAIPYPKQDVLFVDKELYTYTRYDIVGHCAWYIGEFDKGEQALRKGLQENPDNAHLRSNLSFYVDRNIALGKYGVKAIEIPVQKDSLRGPTLWSILICSIAERKDQLDFMVGKLKKQIQQHNLEHLIEVLIFSDNRDCSIGFKRNKLMQASRGTYINFIDDDDDIHENYIKMIYDKLQTGPDCISLVGIRTHNGHNPQLFMHSLEYSTYFMKDDIFYRPPNHLNPIKRELVINYPFPDINWYEDTTWAMTIAKAGCLKREEVINEPYYFYKYTSKG